MEFRRARHCSVYRVSDEFLALDNSSGCCHVLNDTAGWLLSSADEFVSLKQAVGSAETNYRIPIEVDLKAEIEKAVAELAAMHLVEVRQDE